MFRKFILACTLGLCTLMAMPVFVSDTNEAVAQRRSSSRPSYSRPSSRPSYSRPSSSKPSSRYSRPSSSSASSRGKKPNSFSTSYGKTASQARAKAVSKQKFQESKPASSFKSPTGKTIKIDPKDKKIESLRNQVSYEKWKNRDLRRSQFYGSYSNRPAVIYNDPYGGHFHYYMMGQSMSNLALFMYHHQATMDAARYNYMMAQHANSAALRAEIARLQTAGLARNAGYVPAGMNDMDLMYNDSYVNAALGTPHVPVHMQHSSSVGVGTVFLWIIGSVVVIFLLVGIWHLIFRQKF